MRKVLALLSVLVVGALILAACAPGSTGNNGTPLPTSLLTGVPGETGTQALPTFVGTPIQNMGTPPATSAPSETSPVVNPTAVMTTTQVGGTVEPGPMGTVVVPPTGRTSATLLSVLLTYKVVDKNGVELGNVRDFILNLCEAHILYIVLEPSPSLKITAGQAVLIPFEAVSLQGGMVDEGKRELVVNFDSTQLTGLQGVDASTLDLTNPTWESDFIAFWSNFTPMSLTTQCHVTQPELSTTPGAQLTPSPVATPTLPTATMPVTGTPQAGNPGNVIAITKIAFATDVLKAEVQDANAKPLAKVEEVILQPNTGLLRFAVVRLDPSLGNGNNLILVPIRALNLSDKDLSLKKVVLILLVKTEILQGAPTVNAIPDPSTPDWDHDAFNYWSKYVILTIDQSQP